MHSIEEKNIDKVSQHSNYRTIIYYLHKPIRVKQYKKFTKLLSLKEPYLHLQPNYTLSLFKFNNNIYYLFLFLISKIIPKKVKMSVLCTLFLLLLIPSITSNTIPYYKQSDVRWAEEKLGTSQTRLMKNQGSIVCAMAMSLAQKGF